MAAPSNSVTYTTSEDFELGTLDDVVVNGGALEVHPPTPEMFPYVNIACSGRGTVVRIYVGSGDSPETRAPYVVGEYRTFPSNNYASQNLTHGDPSRTTVDHKGNVWVANRKEVTNGMGSVTRIALAMWDPNDNDLVLDHECGDEHSICIRDPEDPTNPGGQYDPSKLYLSVPFNELDRDGDHRIRTSKGLGHILNWADNGFVTTCNACTPQIRADDELIINYTRVDGTAARTMAIDGANDLWVGGFNNHTFQKLHSISGLPFDPNIGFTGCDSSGAYGGLVDQAGQLWSVDRYSDRVLRNTAQAESPLTSCAFNVPGAYGISIDPLTGHIWVSTMSGGSLVYEIEPHSGAMVTHSQGFSRAQGIAVDGNGHVWIAEAYDTNNGGDKVSHLAPDPNGGYFLVGFVTGFEGCTGVAVDANGKIWVSELGGNCASRIDPDHPDSLVHTETGMKVGVREVIVDEDENELLPVSLNYTGQTASASPYNYSDMTGFVAKESRRWHGIWTSPIHDGEVSGGEWARITWNDDTCTQPDLTWLKVRVRTSDSATALPGLPWRFLPADGNLCGFVGQYIQVQVLLQGSNFSGSGFRSPKLCDLTIDGGSGGGISHDCYDMTTPCEPPGSGLTIEDPYRISHICHLVWMSIHHADDTSGQYYKLINDIDASGTVNWNDEGTTNPPQEGFAPIGTDSDPFRGHFDGQDYTITGLTINRPYSQHVGLFGVVTSTGSDSGHVHNLIMEGGSVTGAQYVGGLIGLNDGGAVSNCSTSSEVAGSSYVGGLIGENHASVSNCSASGDVTTGMGAYIGGLLGYSDCSVSYCHATGSVTASDFSGAVGGLVGYSGGSVAYCYATGSVTVSLMYTGPTGGLLGQSNADVSECYASGQVMGEYSVGGLIGEVKDGTVSDCYATGATQGTLYVGGLAGRNIGTVRRCYSVGEVSGLSGYTGGLLGFNTGTVQYSYWDTEASDVPAPTPPDGRGEGRTTAQMRQPYHHINNPNTYVGWDFVNTWTMCYNSSYPYLVVFGAAPPAGSGTQAAPYKISNLCQLVWMSDNVGSSAGKYYELTTNIDASDTANWNEGFKPIGDFGYMDPSNAFQGHFDGDKHTISNLTIDREGSDNVGLFGATYLAEVRNLGVTGGRIRGHYRVGSVVGYNLSSLVEYCHATDVEVGGELFVGGLVGNNDSGMISKCYSTGSVASDLVSATHAYAGGLVGDNVGDIENSYSNCNVSGPTTVGGLAGANDVSGRAVSKCYAVGRASSSIVGGMHIGNLFGYDFGGNTIEYSYYNAEISPGASAGGTPLSGNQMRQSSSFDQWDFTNVWNINPGVSYPYLRNMPSLLIQQPSNATVATGTTAELTVLASDETPISYQWKKDGVNLIDGGKISGATTSTLQISGADTNDAGNYICYATFSTYGNVASNVTTLEVGTNGTLTNPGFEADTAGDPPTGWATYIQPGTSGNWTLQTVSPPEGSQYQQTQVYAVNSYGGVNQAVTGLADGVVYTITGSYKTNSIAATSSVRYNLSGDTNPANSTELVSKTGTTWTSFSGAVTASGSSLMLFLEHMNGATSNKASGFDNIVVTCVPVVSEQPGIEVVCPGYNASFAIAATGQGTLSFQWRKDGQNLSDGGPYSGCTTATLSITDVDSIDTGYYSCVVTGDCGVTESELGQLYVDSTLTNGDFEADAQGNPPTGWTTYIQSNKSGNWTLQTVSPPQGTQWQQTQVYNRDSWGGVYQTITGLNDQMVYTISGSYRTNSATATASVRYNLSGSTDRSNSTVLVSKSDTTWGTFSQNVTASGGTLTLFLDHLNGASSNKAAAFDNIKVNCAQ